MNAAYNADPVEDDLSHRRDAAFLIGVAQDGRGRGRRAPFDEWVGKEATRR